MWLGYRWYEREPEKIEERKKKKETKKNKGGDIK